MFQFQLGVWEDKKMEHQSAINDTSINHQVDTSTSIRMVLPWMYVSNSTGNIRYNYRYTWTYCQNTYIVLMPEWLTIWYQLICGSGWANISRSCLLLQIKFRCCINAYLDYFFVQMDINHTFQQSGKHCKANCLMGKMH